MPIAYSVEGAKDKERMYAHGRLSFMGYFLRVFAKWDKSDGVDYSIKLLGFELKGLLEGDGKAKADSSEENNKSQSKDDGPAEEHIHKTKPEDTSETIKTEAFADEIPVNKDEAFKTNKETEESKEALDESLGKKLSAAANRIKQIYEDIVTMPERISDKYKSLKADAEKRAAFFEEKKELLYDERFMSALKSIFEDFKVLCKKIKPKSGAASVKAGFEDPYYTGCMAALYSILYPTVGEMVTLTTDFENTVFEGDFYFKGKITVFVVLYFIYRVYFKDDFSYIKEKAL